MSVQTRLLSSNYLADDAQAAVPDLTLFSQYNPQRYPYLLSSTAVRENNTQYDILIACPQYTLTLNADKTLSCSDKQLSLSNTFLDTLAALYERDKQPATDDIDLPFSGGWFVYLSYEMAAEIEPCLSLPVSSKAQPLAIAARCPAAIIVDKNSRQCFAIAESQQAHLLDQLEQDYRLLSKQFAAQPARSTVGKIELASLTEDAAEPYLQQVEKIKQYIVDGDIFQANLSRQWQAKLKHDIDDAELFTALSKQNPSSFAAMVRLPEMTIISSSPERLVSVKNAIVETRPIAGTRRRDPDQLKDKALSEELLSHPKEQAEHIMLIDLERNDLGRVCRPGSIKVNELMVLETWEHVHHIVSNVRGELQKDKSPVDVLRAVFPGGTITGCPKVRCIEILTEMEQQARGAYTGSLGYINNDGSMDFNILIRTMVRENNTLTFRAGGGIVSDSIAEKELEETRAKAKGLLKIFELDE